MFKLNCRISPIKFNKKPNNFKSIDASIVDAPNITATPTELLKGIEQGQTYLLGHLKDNTKGRTKGNLEGIQALSLDIDNEYVVKDAKVYGTNTIESVTKKFNKLLDAKPLISYETFSSNNANRFRIIYALDTSLSESDVNLIYKYLVDSTEFILDEQCKSCNRMYLGTNKKGTFYKDFKEVDTSILLDSLRLEEQQRQEEIKLKYSNRGNTIVDKINNQSMREYLEKFVGQSPTEQGRMKCPIHNSSNDTTFSVTNYNGIDLYTCYSSCGTGNLIQLHQQLNDLDFNDAVKELTRLYSIGNDLTPSRNVVNESIGKYITDSKETLETITTALKDYHKLCITSPLGSGKTTLIKNEFVKYAKDHDAVTIVIIPNVKQLDYMEKTLGFKVVHGKSPMSNDIDVNTPIATTPESLHKIIHKLELRPYVLIVDETQERITSRYYRNGYKYDNIEKIEGNSLKSIHMTATPTPLIADDFDVIIDIDANEMITAKVEIVEMEKSTYENLTVLCNQYLSKDYRVLLANNNRNVNAEILDYSKNMIPNLTTEYIDRDTESENINNGILKADITTTTSAITSGIDLKSDKETVVIINTKEKQPLSNIYQTIGRIREGLSKVIIVIEDTETKDIVNIKTKVAERLQANQLMADDLNSKSYMQELVRDKNSLSEIGHLERINNVWVVNVSDVVAEIYSEYSKSVLSDANYLIQSLKEQKAFRVEGDIIISNFIDSGLTFIQDSLKDKKKEQKEIKENAIKFLLQLDDAVLNELITKVDYLVSDDIKEVYRNYVSVANDDFKKMKQIRLNLLDNKYQYVEAFRKLHTSRSWASIEREIERVKTKERNQLMNIQGLDAYLSIGDFRGKKSKDVVQAVIRKELEGNEKKRCRLSQKKLTDLTTKLIANDHLHYTKDLKTYKDIDSTKEDREKAFLNIVGDIGKLLGNIYNLTDDNRISSLNI